MPSSADRELYETLVIVSWLYAANEMGMPSQEENQQLLSFEDALEKAIDAAGVGVHAASITGRGVREWRYYTSDSSEFMAAANHGLQGHPVYPVEFQMFKDPDWSALAELMPPS